MNNYKKIDINKIKPDTNQPRKYFDQEKIEDMAQSMKTQGQINAIEIDSNNMIITGETRWKAAKLAGLDEVDCKIIPKIDKDERMFRQIVENVHNSTMNDIDLANAYLRLLKITVHQADTSNPLYEAKKNVWNDEGIRELARRIGRGKSHICEKLDILKMSPKFQKLLAKQEIPSTMLRAIKRAPEKYREKLEEKIVKKEIKTRDGAEAIADAMNKNPDDAEEIINQDYSKCNTSDDIKDVARNVASGAVSVEESIDNTREQLDPENELYALALKITTFVGKYPFDELNTEEQKKRVKNILAMVIFMLNDYLSRENKPEVKVLDVIESENENKNI